MIRSPCVVTTHWTFFFCPQMPKMSLETLGKQHKSVKQLVYILEKLLLDGLVIKCFLYISDWRGPRRVHPGWFSRRWCHAVRCLGTGKTIFCSQQERVRVAGSRQNLLWEMASLIIHRPMDLGCIERRQHILASQYLNVEIIPRLPTLAV